MLTMPEWNKAVKYRVTDSWTYQWECYGPNAMALESRSPNDDNTSSTIIFDSVNGTVYEVTVHDSNADLAFRLVNPDYREAMFSEASRKKSEYEIAWDVIRYIDLESSDDFIGKCTAIFNGEKYDYRVLVPLYIDNDIYTALSELAATRNMSTEELASEIITKSYVSNTGHDGGITFG